MSNHGPSLPIITPSIKTKTSKIGELRVPSTAARSWWVDILQDMMTFFVSELIDEKQRRKVVRSFHISLDHLSWLIVAEYSLEVWPFPNWATLLHAKSAAWWFRSFFLLYIYHLLPGYQVVPRLLGLMLIAPSSCLWFVGALTATVSFAVLLTVFPTCGGTRPPPC